MARTSGDDTAFDGSSDECHVADDVEQFVARTFVFPLQRFRLDVTDFRRVHVRHFQQVGEVVELLLADLTLVDDDGVFEVAALDEVGVEQRHDVAHKHEGAGWSHFRGKIVHIVERGELAVDEFRLERAHRRYRKLVVGQNRDARTRFLVANFDFLANDEPFFRGGLLFDAHLADFLDIHECRAVENRKFGSIDLNQAVVDAEGVECSEGVFNGRNAHVALCQNGSALGVCDFLGDGLDDGLSFEVDALNAVAGVFGYRIERHGEVQTRVQPFTRKRKTVFEGLLLDCFHHYNLRFDYLQFDNLRFFTLHFQLFHLFFEFFQLFIHIGQTAENGL